MIILEHGVVAAKKTSWIPHALFLSLLFLVLVHPATAMAVQQHGGLEGMVVHELGHLLFMGGMLFLLYRMDRPATRRLTRGSGWFAFRLFIWLIIIWNLMTFYGHWHEEVIDPAKFVLAEGRKSAFIISRPLDLLFYLSRLDHLVLLPAFLTLFVALRKWRNQG